MAPSTFHYFGRLPPELRRQVFYEYLSPYDAPAVYLYNRNFIIRFTDPEGEDERYAGISHEPLVQVPTPELLRVSSEARGATLSWASQRGISLRYRPESRRYALTRAFDPASDALYVSREMWEEFCELPWDSFDGLEQMAASIRHLALPAFTAYYSFTELGGYLLEWFTGLEVLSAVWGELPEVRFARTKRVPRPRLRLLDGEVGADDDDDDDGTDTGVDPLTGEREVQIAAELQPVWRLEPETDEVVRMSVRDPVDGLVSWEEGELGMWMDELEEAFATVELPENMYDAEDGVLLVKFEPMRAVNVKV